MGIERLGSRWSMTTDRIGQFETSLLFGWDPQTIPPTRRSLRVGYRSQAQTTTTTTTTTAAATTTTTNNNTNNINIHTTSY